MKYVAPSRAVKAFTCPHCGVYAGQEWWYNGGQMNGTVFSNSAQNPIALSRCTHCMLLCSWFKDKMVYPIRGFAPPPNPDLPADVVVIYEEAAAISNQSPRGAAALLRLAIQILTKHLGGKGENINADIQLLVSKGLPPMVQQSLDVVRVIGNNAVHPGQIDVDDPKVVGELFTLINIIAQYLISLPKQVSSLYTNLPTGSIEAIEKRDGKARPA